VNTAEATFDNPDHETDEPYHDPGERLSVAPDAVEVRRAAGLAALVGAAASAVAIAYLSRAVQTAAVLDWALFAVMGGFAVTYLRAFVDARTPLLVADGQGVRIRLGRTWRGLPWGALSEVANLPRRGLVRDGRLTLVPHNPDRVFAELDASGRRQAGVNRRLYGAPLAVPLGLSTRVTGADGDLTTALRTLAGDRAIVVEVTRAAAVATEEHVEDGETGENDPIDDAIDPAPEAFEPDEDRARSVEPVQQVEPDGEPVDMTATTETTETTETKLPRARRTLLDPRPALAARISSVASRLGRSGSTNDDNLDDLDEDLDDTDDVDLDPVEETESGEVELTQPLVASVTPQALRLPHAGQRTEVTRDVVLGAAPESVDGRELRRAGSVNLVEDTVAWGDRVRPIARAGDAVEPLVIDDFGVQPAEDPVVGPELCAARTRLGLTVDQLAERTRIRPHVIESIEADDFAPCGGDFYARGHLRTLARVLGVDAAPLLATYDERYADAPINPRRVFEAELATGINGSIRSTGGGTNWSLLVGVVMALILAWSLARLVMDDPTELQRQPLPLNGSPVDTHQPANVIAEPVAVKLSAVKADVHVVVRDGNGEIVFSGDLALGQTKRLEVQPPVKIKTSDGGATEAKVAGVDQGTLGQLGVRARATFSGE
jgi:cytoskeletal protein RodZ